MTGSGSKNKVPPLVLAANRCRLNSGGKMTISRSRFQPCKQDEHTKRIIDLWSFTFPLDKKSHWNSRHRGEVRETSAIKQRKHLKENPPSWLQWLHPVGVPPRHLRLQVTKGDVRWRRRGVKFKLWKLKLSFDRPGFDPCLVTWWNNLMIRLIN